jgi:hypothetical protein
MDRWLGMIAFIIANLGMILIRAPHAKRNRKNQIAASKKGWLERALLGLASLAGVVSSADAAPTEQSYAVYEDIAGKIDVQLAALKECLDQDLPAFNQLVREKNVPAVILKEKKKE